jgi:hypothetical protein
MSIQDAPLRLMRCTLLQKWGENETGERGTGIRTTTVRDDLWDYSIDMKEYGTYKLWI